MTKRRLAGGLFTVGVVASPLVKWAQFEWAPGADHWRQLGLVVAGAVAVAVVARRPMEALVGSQLARPRPPLPELLALNRLLRLALGALAVVLCATSVVAAVAGNRAATIGLSVAGLALVAILGCWEIVRHRHTQTRGAGDRAPDRAVLWAVAPAVLWWTILVVRGAVAGSDFDGSLAADPLFLSGAPGEALFTVLVIGSGEEYLYRGLLLVLAIRAELQTVGLTLISLSFGFWHLPDALDKGAAAMVLTVAGMTIASQLVLIPLRLRCRSLAGPALLHSANNLAMRMVSHSG